MYIIIKNINNKNRKGYSINKSLGVLFLIHKHMNFELAYRQKDIKWEKYSYLRYNRYAVFSGESNTEVSVEGEDRISELYLGINFVF